MTKLSRIEADKRRSALAPLLLALLLPAAVLAAVDRERSQQFYEQALEEFRADGFTAAVIQLRNALQQDPSNLPARILLGKTLLEEGQPQAAIKELEMALSLGGDENLILVALGKAFMQIGEPERVITGIVAGNHEARVDGEIYLLHASAYGMLGNVKLAEQAYLSAGVLLPADPRPLIARAQLALTRKKHDLADKLVAQAVALAPDSFDVWLFKAMAHRDLGQPRPALAAFARALELRPTSGRALAARAALWMDLGEAERARADLEKARDLGSETLETIYLRTLLLFSEGKSAEARELLRESADDIRTIKDDVRQKLSNTDLMLGVVAYFEENFEEAAAHLRTFLKKIPDHSGAKRYLAASYIGLAEWDLAIRVYRQGPNSQLPQDPTALSMLAEAYRSKGDYSAAERHYEAALEAAPNLAGLGVRLAVSRLDAGKPEVALKELKWFVEKFPELLEAQIQLARVYVKLGQFAEAVVVIRTALAKHADDANAHTIAGAIYLAAGDVAQARDHLRLASSIDPDLILPKLNLARLDKMEGNSGSAETQYRSLLEDHPFHVESGLELAQLLLQQGQTKEAQERIAVVLEVKPDSYEAHALELQAFLKKGAPREQVRNAAFEFVRRFEEDPRAAFSAGKIFAELGDAEDARVQFRHAVQQADFDAAALLATATEQVRLKDLNGALWALTKALQGNPNNFDVAIAKVDVLIQLNDLDNAGLLVDEIAAAHGEAPGLLIKRGDLLVAQNNLEAATVFYTRAYDEAPSAMTARTLFSALIISQQPEAASGIMDAWLKANPSDAVSRNLYAEALMHLERYPLARVQFDRLREDGFTNVALLNNHAMVLQIMGDERALGTARAAYEMAPEAWGVLDTYGWILAMNGKPEEGLAMLREAYARSSTSVEVRYHIGVALMKLGRNAAALEEFEAALADGRDFRGDDDARKLAEQVRVMLSEKTSAR